MNFFSSEEYFLDLMATGLQSVVKISKRDEYYTFIVLHLWNIDFQAGELSPQR